MAEKPKFKMTHNEYQEFLKENASKIFNDKNYSMEDYERDADNVEVIGFDLERFSLSEEKQKCINSWFATDEQSILGNMLLRGSVMNRDFRYVVADELGCDNVYDEGIRCFYKNDEDKMIFDYCEGDIVLILCETEDAYKKEVERSCKFYEIEMPVLKGRKEFFGISDDKLSLNDLSNIDKLIKEYNLNVPNKRYAWDSDLEQLFDASGIKYVETINKEKEFNFNDDYEPVGLDYGDYIETIVLEQDGVRYSCPIYCEFNGVGAENCLAFHEMKEMGKEKHGVDEMISNAADEVEKINKDETKEVYKGYNLRYYPKSEKHPTWDDRYQVNKPRPYDDADYYTAHSYDKENWKIIYKGKVAEEIKGSFHDVVDSLEKYNEKIRPQMCHW